MSYIAVGAEGDETVPAWELEARRQEARGRTALAAQIRRDGQDRFTASSARAKAEYDARMRANAARSRGVTVTTSGEISRRIATEDQRKRLAQAAKDRKAVADQKAKEKQAAADAAAAAAAAQTIYPADLETTQQGQQEQVPQQVSVGGGGMMLPLLGVAAVGALWYFKGRKKGRR